MGTAEMVEMMGIMEVIEIVVSEAVQMRVGAFS